MDDLGDRYARLVAAFGAEERSAVDLDRLATEADELAATAESSWLRVQARALAGAARAVSGAEPDLETIVDASAPPLDEPALERLEELLPGGESLVDRLAAHDRAMRLPQDVLRSTAQRLIDLLRQRAAEDLELPAEHHVGLQVVEGPGMAWGARLDSSTPPARLVLNGRAGWTADRLTRAISSLAYPGAHLARLMRPPAAEWSPSPETTVDSGLAAVGREILLADHELAHELERIGRGAGLSWDGNRIVAVRRALDDLAPAYAAAATGRDGDTRRRLASLGADPQAAEALVEAWRDPLERATTLARAAGPPLVRAWLVETGQTTGLRRLLTERLVPTMLRAEIPNARD